MEKRGLSLHLWCAFLFWTLGRWCGSFSSRRGIAAAIIGSGRGASGSEPVCDYASCYREQGVKHLKGFCWFISTEEENYHKSPLLQRRMP